MKGVFPTHPAWQPVKATPFQLPQMNADGDPPNTWQLIAAGMKYFIQWADTFIDHMPPQP